MAFYVTTPIYYVNAAPHLGPRVHDDRAPTSSPATCASAARTCSSSPAPTSTASRSRRRPSARASRRKELADRNAAALQGR